MYNPDKKMKNLIRTVAERIKIGPFSAAAPYLAPGLVLGLMCPRPDWKRAERETGRNIPGIWSTDCTTKYRLIWVDINQKGKSKRGK